MSHMRDTPSRLLPWSDIDQRYRRAVEANSSEKKLPTTYRPLANRFSHDAAGLNRKRFDRLTPHLARLGQVSDTVLAQETGLYRSFVSTVRAYLGIARCRRQASPLDHPQKEKIITWIKEGKALKWIGQQLAFPISVIRPIAASIGWHRSWVVNTPRRTHVGRIAIAQVLAWYESGRTLADIGSRAGVSRERIRQVVMREGKEPRRVILARIREAKAVLKKRAQQLKVKQRQSRRLKFLKERLAVAHRLWKQGESVKDIAHHGHMGLSSLLGYITKARGELGWFTPRIRKKMTDQETFTNPWHQQIQQKHDQMIHRQLPALRQQCRLAKQMWKSGEKTQAIALRYGMSRSAIGELIRKGRRLLGWFPHRYRIIASSHRRGSKKSFRRSAR